jgi:hypothetical protein
MSNIFNTDPSKFLLRESFAALKDSNLYFIIVHIDVHHRVVLLDTAIDRTTSEHPVAKVNSPEASRLETKMVLRHLEAQSISLSSSCRSRSP